MTKHEHRTPRNRAGMLQRATSGLIRKGAGGNVARCRTARASRTSAQPQVNTPHRRRSGGTMAKLTHRYRFTRAWRSSGDRSRVWAEGNSQASRVWNKGTAAVAAAVAAAEISKLI